MKMDTMNTSTRLVLFGTDSTLRILIYLILTNKYLCASGAETRFSVTAESNGMLCIPLQRNTM